MRDLAVLFLHLLTTVVRLAGPGGARSVVAESVLVKQQLLILNGHRAHAGLAGRTPEPSFDAGSARATVSSYRWQPHCRGLYQTPIAA